MQPMLKAILQPLYTGWVLLTFLLSLVVLFPVFAVVSLGNNLLARKIIHGTIRYWCMGWLRLIGMPVRPMGTMPQGRHIIVANHISYMDTLVIFPAIHGYFRPLGKKEISRIPVVGFIYKQVVIMVDRSSAVSRAASMRVMWRVLRKEGSILIFPEGTFNETDNTLKSFYDGAFRLAITTQTDVLPLILPDTEQRWHYSGWWKLWPGKNRTILLRPVSVQGMTMSDLPDLKQKVYGLMEAALEKHQKK